VPLGTKGDTDLTIIETLITSYGLLAVVVLLALAGVVWLVSHLATKPGGKVSVLWGLATYDRRESNILSGELTKLDEKISQNVNGEALAPSEVTDLKRDGQQDSLAEQGDRTKQVLIARFDDYLLVDTETQRASSDLAVYRKGEQLSQLAVVSLTLELRGNRTMAKIELHLKRKRPGEIISALPQILGEVGYQNMLKVTPLGIQISLQNMQPGERFRLQMLTDGLRVADFYLVQESRSGSVELRTEKSEDWQP
jgi:hypothetical protein